MHKTFSLKKLIRIGGVAFILLALTLLSACGEASQSTSISQPEQTVYMAASWPTYKDIGSLKREADVAIAGTVTKLNRSFESTKKTPYSDFEFAIREVIWDPNQLLQSTNSLVIRQTGGTINNTKFELHEDPLFKPGEKTLVFLKVYSLQESVTLGPSGRFTIENGLVKPMSDAGVKVTNPKSEVAFITEIKSTPIALPTIVNPPSIASLPKVVVGQTINPAQLYELNKAQTILVKGEAKQASISDNSRIRAIVAALDKPNIALAVPSQPDEMQPGDGVYLVFIFADGKSISFQFNRKLGYLTTGDSPDLVRITAPSELPQLLV